MTVAIMQPYLFPYLGYLQLLHAADCFVLYDDVKWIKGGWINRNRILLGGAPHRFTFSIERGSSHHQIAERAFSHEVRRERDAFLRTLRHGYAGAPHYEGVRDLVSDCLDHIVNVDRDVTAAVRYSLERILEYLDLPTPIVRSSDLGVPCGLSGEARVLELCGRLGATVYVNAPGGAALYAPEAFDRRGICLRFLDSLAPEYEQGGVPFVPDLSVIDVLMFNGPEGTRELLGRYALIRKADLLSRSHLPTC